MLEGVACLGQRAQTNSLILRGETKTRRRIFAEHLLSQLICDCNSFNNDRRASKSALTMPSTAPRSTTGIAEIS